MSATLLFLHLTHGRSNEFVMKTVTGAFLVPARNRRKGKENSFPGLLRDADDDDVGVDDDDGTCIIPKLIFFQLILFLI